MLFDDIKVSKKQGDIGVARAIYEYTRMGYTVLAPLSDSDKYDLVVDDGENLLRVQVKTSRQNNATMKHTAAGRTGYTVNLATKGGNTKINNTRVRQDGDYELLFVLLEDGRAWSIPVEALTARTSICLGADGSNAKYGAYQIK